MDGARPGSLSSKVVAVPDDRCDTWTCPICGGPVAHQADMGHLHRLPRECLIPEYRIGDECLTRRDEPRARRRISELAATKPDDPAGAPAAPEPEAKQRIMAMRLRQDARKQIKIAAVERGTTAHDLMIEPLHRPRMQPLSARAAQCRPRRSGDLWIDCGYPTPRRWQPHGIRLARAAHEAAGSRQWVKVGSLGVRSESM